MLLLIYVYLQSREKEGEEKGGEEKKKDNEINNKRPGPSDKLLFILL